MKIKFRAWLKPSQNRNGRIIKVDEIWFSRNRIKEENQTEHSLVDSVLMQFITNDTKNNEVFEGDIVEFWPLKRYEKSNLVGMVEFYEPEARFRITQKTELGESFWGFHQCEKIYVIGNIYEHSYLLDNPSNKIIK